MVKAVVLVRAEPEVSIAELKKIPGVKDAFQVTGRFDLAVLIEVEDLSKIREVVFNIHGLRGVRRTETLIHIE